MMSLYELDRDALKAFTNELKAVLATNDGAKLGDLLELGEGLRGQLTSASKLVDLFLLSDDDKRVAPLWASMRRISRKRAMTKVFTSTHPSLEGRLRAYDILRDDAAIARSIDRLLSPRRLPWYLRREGSTCGWLDGPERETLATQMRKLAPSLTPELKEALGGLEMVDADVVAHDGM